MHLIAPDWPAPAAIKAYTTTKLAYESADVSLESILSLPATPIRLHQVHGATALPATHENMNADADASYTSNPDTVCLILTADCLPILICNKEGTKVAAIHAGWRGLAAGVLESTLKGLNEPGSNLLVWLGPAIGPEKFEVGHDVYEAFTRQDAKAAAAFKKHQQDKWLANLYKLAKMRLRHAGIVSIYGGNFCTHTQSDLFYSYRRDGKNTGRMASLIWIASCS